MGKKKYISNHPKYQLVSNKYKGNFNFKRPGERELRCLAGEILNSFQRHPQHQHHQFDIDLLNQQYDDFCLYNHSSMRGMIFWGNHFDDDKEIKQVIRDVLSDVNCFTMMVLSNALSICLSECKINEIEKDICSLIDQINEGKDISPIS